ncbi:MAG: protein phosphatase 2C domain-containing protein [Planctomycetota bacterium]|jgi:serine/threonine protein phosphatase PrpC
MSPLPRFESRVFKLAKDAERPEENQDACRADAARGIAAIADGVASAIFSRKWAGILTEAAVADPPNPNDRDAFREWLAARREAWSAQINVADLAWFQKPKLREGAFSTLLWVEVLPLDESDREPADPWRLRVFAIGDSCLFHVREGRTLRTFPVEKAEEFNEDPLVVGSVDLNRDELLRFESLEEICRPGDLLALCTDAVAEWALKEQNAGNLPAWEKCWTKTEEAWQEEILALRNDRRMRHDDATLLLLRVSDGATEPTSTAPAAARSPAPTTPPPAEPPPLPSEPPRLPDWGENLKTLSQQLAAGVSKRVARGIEKLKGLKEKAGSAFRRYRERLRSDDETRPDDP